MKGSKKMEGIIIEEVKRNGLVLQIIKTEECGGRYYLVVNGILGFHSLDLDRVKKYMQNYIV